MAFLRPCNCRLHFLPAFDLALQAPETPSRYPMGPGSPRTRLRWDATVHRRRRSGLRRSHLHDHCPIFRPQGNRFAGFRIRCCRCLCTMGTIYAIEATTVPPGNFCQRQRKRVVSFVASFPKYFINMIMNSTYPFIAGVIVNMFFYSVNIAYPTFINVLWTDATTPLSYSLELTLPQNLGLIFGSMMLWFFGLKIQHWKWQFAGTFFVMTLFGALLALAKPDNRAMIMVFVFICEGAYGWAQTLSITFIQMGVPQTQLGISGALA